jgi:hypothetical protein
MVQVTESKGRLQDGTGRQDVAGAGGRETRLVEVIDTSEIDVVLVGPTAR